MTRSNFNIVVTGGMCLVVFCSLVSLGIWQLNRADEKKALIEMLESRQQDEPMRLRGDSTSPDKLRFRRVRVTGTYDPEHQFLLDNQVLNGKIGVFVLTPLKIEGSRYSVLVNRGWVPMTNRRIENSNLDIQTVRVRIKGLVNHFPGLGFKFNGAEIPTDEWPGLIQLVDANVLSDVLGYPLLPFQVLLDPEIQAGFVRDWKISYPVSPEKHTAYAVQWFALAITFLLILVWRGTRSNE